MINHVLPVILARFLANKLWHDSTESVIKHECDLVTQDHSCPINNLKYLKVHHSLKSHFSNIDSFFFFLSFIIPIYCVTKTLMLSLTFYQSVLS